MSETGGILPVIGTMKLELKLSDQADVTSAVLAIVKNGGGKVTVQTLVELGMSDVRVDLSLDMLRLFGGSEQDMARKVAVALREAAAGAETTAPALVPNANTSIRVKADSDAAVAEDLNLLRTRRGRHIVSSADCAPLSPLMDQHLDDILARCGKDVGTFCATSCTVMATDHTAEWQFVMSPLPWARYDMGVSVFEDNRELTDSYFVLVKKGHHNIPVGDASGGFVLLDARETLDLLQRVRVSGDSVYIVGKCCVSLVKGTDGAPEFLTSPRWIQVLTRAVTLLPKPLADRLLESAKSAQDRITDPEARGFVVNFTQVVEAHGPTALALLYGDTSQFFSSPSGRCTPRSQVAQVQAIEVVSVLSRLRMIYPYGEDVAGFAIVLPRVFSASQPRVISFGVNGNTIGDWEVEQRELDAMHILAVVSGGLHRLREIVRGNIQRGRTLVLCLREPMYALSDAMLAVGTVDPIYDADRRIVAVFGDVSVLRLVGLFDGMAGTTFALQRLELFCENYAESGDLIYRKSPELVAREAARNA